MEGNDSKVSRSFLRMVLKEQGQPVPEELVLNSWEMVDLIIKNIHLVNIEINNLRKQAKKRHREMETLSQGVLDAVSAFYSEKAHEKSRYKDSYEG